MKLTRTLCGSSLGRFWLLRASARGMIGSLQRPQRLRRTHHSSLPSNRRQQQQEAAMAAQQQHQDHPIFDTIELGDLEAVQQRVLAAGAALEERLGMIRRTPLMHAIQFQKPVIALWLIEHRGQHDVDAVNEVGWTALHYASMLGALEVVQALVVAGANPAALTGDNRTPLMLASWHGRTDIVAFLLQLPAVKASIDAMDRFQYTALSFASSNGQQPIVQLLLDAGADPTLPAGDMSPIDRALYFHHYAVAAFLRQAIADPERVRECVALVERKGGLCEDVYVKLRGFLLHAWAWKMPAGVVRGEGGGEQAVGGVNG